MKKVLFLCTGNSCRSQMAEGLLRHMAGDKVQVFSAGVHPSFLHPMAVKVMAEIGIDISSHSSKSVGEFIDQSFDYVVTLCDHARQSCPLFPGKHRKIHWNVLDPAIALGNEEERLKVFRKIRDVISLNCQNFVKMEKLTIN